METHKDEQRTQLLQLAKALDDKKGFNLMAIDIQDLSQIADYFLIAEGNVEKHLEALADHVIEKAKVLGLSPVHVEGKGADWLVIDFAGIMAHLMLPETRERYKLERIWQQGTLVELGL